MSRGISSHCQLLAARAARTMTVAAGAPSQKIAYLHLCRIACPLTKTKGIQSCRLHASIWRRQGKTPEYRATVADVVYGGIVGVLKAPEGDRFMVIGEHSSENFVNEPSFLGIEAIA